MREYVTREELIALLNKQLSAVEECRACYFNHILRLREPQPDGRNWSSTVSLACSGQPVEVCYRTAQRILRVALDRYNLRSEGGWLDDLSFQHRGHSCRCVSQSRGVASIDPDGPFARPSPSIWWVTIDSDAEYEAFESSPDDVNSRELRERVIRWAIDSGSLA